MPIQPRSPTRRENSLASASSRLGLNGLKVPAAISSARNARTSLRNFSHSGGRRIGSKRRAAVMLEVSTFVQANLVSDQREATSGHNSSAPRAATSLPSSTAQKLSEPKSSRQASARKL